MNYANWAAGACAFSTGFHLLTLAIAAARIGRRRSATEPPHGAEPVSIVVPVCGIDNFADATLASAFALDHPNYEIVFCVADADDPVLPLLRRAIAAHREIPAQLLVGDQRISVNPKLNNCIKGWDAARHPWIAVADSNVLMPPDYITRLLARWQPDTGVVCSMPIGSRPEGFAAELECAFLNTLQARYQYVGESVGQGFAQGKTMLFRRDLVERAGGIRALAAEVAEDAATTKMVRASGRRVHLVDLPFDQPLGHRTIRQVWSRQLRWARLRRVTFAWLFLPEIFVGSALPMFAAAVAAHGYGMSVPATIAALLCLWGSAEMGLAAWAGWHHSWRLPPALLIRDLLLPALWLMALLGSDFVWRGNAMTVEGERRRRRGGSAVGAQPSRKVTEPY